MYSRLAVAGVTNLWGSNCAGDTTAAVASDWSDGEDITAAVASDWSNGEDTTAHNSSGGERLVKWGRHNTNSTCVWMFIKMFVYFLQFRVA